MNVERFCCILCWMTTSKEKPGISGEIYLGTWCPKAVMGSTHYIKPPAQVCGVVVFDGFYQLHQGHRTSADPPWPQFKRFLSPQQLPTAAVDSAPRFETPRTATWMIKCPQSLNPHSLFCKLWKCFFLGV